MLGYTFVMLLALLGIFYIYCKRKFNYFREKGIPHRKPTIFFGNLLEFLFHKECPAKYFAELYKQFDAPCIGFYSLTKPYLLLKDPNLIKQILIKDFASFQNRCFLSDNTIESVMSNSLFAIRGSKWRELRKKLSPVFTSGKVKLMLPLIAECGKHLETYLFNRLNQNLDMKDVCAKYTIDVIASCAFGLNTDTFEKNSEFRSYGRLLFPVTIIDAYRVLSYTFVPVLINICRYPFFKKQPTDFFRKVFLETLKSRELYTCKRNDLVDLINEIKSKEKSDDALKFNDDIVCAQAVTFFGAAQEGTSSLISFTLHELSINPDIQQKLRKEILTEIEKCGGITYEAVQNMSYLDMVVSETSRKYPLTPVLNRECVQNYLLPETGLSIEKGTAIMISQMGLHWDSQYFPNPTRYDPERFNKENKSKIPNYVYLPFGDGPRNCIGERFGLLSSKLGLIYILKNFKVEANSKTLEPIVFDKAPLLRAKYGINLTIKRF